MFILNGYLIHTQISINFIRARLAQSVERWTLNPTVVGSSPTLGATFASNALYHTFKGI